MPGKDTTAPRNGYFPAHCPSGVLDARVSAALTVRRAPHLHEDRGAQVLVSIPPVARAAGTAAGAENTLIEAVLCGEKGQSGAHRGRDGCALS